MDAAALLGAGALHARRLRTRRRADAAERRRRRLDQARQILIYSLLLAPLGALPCLLGYAGPLYGVCGAAARRRVRVAAPWLLWHARTTTTPIAAAEGLFGFSILYLFGLFAVRLVESGVWRGLIGG